MSNAAVENLGKLNRKITLSFPRADLEKEIQARLARLAKTVKMPGFRPGKVPLKKVEQQYGPQVQFEVEFNHAAKLFGDVARAQDIRVAGQPRLQPKIEDGGAEQVVYEALFEVFPEVRLGDMSSLTLKRPETTIGEGEIDRTIDILRKQHTHFHDRGHAGHHGDGGADTSAQNGDRVTLDFVGCIDGMEFAGGKAEGFSFVLGEGRMLSEFEKAAVGTKVDDEKTFDLTFPADYHGKEVAGKTAQFTITIRKVEWPHPPEMTDDFVEHLGVREGGVAQMRVDVRDNLEREVKRRVVSLLKDQVMEGLIKTSELDLPQSLVASEQEFLVEMARQDMAQRGMPNAKQMPIPMEIFKDQAERRVKLGLILNEVVKANGLEAKPEQIKAEVEDMAKSYQDPAEVVRWYYADPSRLGDVEAAVLENNVVEFVASRAKTTVNPMTFEELTAPPVPHGSAA
ncbi:MAG: trigger factor [Candidatus Protistobacter heckmanni]|nr:trigger factor [Candidatus Protistobacter heckmanni]